VLRIPDRKEAITAHGAKSMAHGAKETQLSVVSYQLSARGKTILAAVLVILAYPSLNFPLSRSPSLSITNKASQRSNSSSHSKSTGGRPVAGPVLSNEC